MTYTLHIKDRMTASISAMNDIKHLQRISLQTIMKLFKVKILPVITYGLHSTWQHLTKSNLTDVEKVKAFLKRALCVSKYSSPRLVYELCRETMLLEDLRLQLLLPSTPAYEAAITEHQRKKREIPAVFYATDAMTTEDWKEADYELRHTVTRFAVHGFHFRICSRKSFHEPNQTACAPCAGKCAKNIIR
ncbi:hypothetical protein C0J52_11219 [Blattella germanica]|nr:hypothetical protein C0J52_11219 [Blattella germanica]